MVSFANAQYLLQESFEDFFGNVGIPEGWTTIDADGDGYDWYAYGSEGMKAHSGTGVATSASYADGALTPDNYLVTPPINLVADAELSFWIIGQDPSYAQENFTVYISTTGAEIADFTTVLVQGTSSAEYVKYTADLSQYTGETVYIAFRHHITSDMFRINLDDVEIFAVPTEPMIQAAASIEFPTTLLLDESVKTVEVSAYLLTSGITATTAAPFSVSADGETFGTTATIPQNGGTLYVKFAPEAEGLSTGSVTLTSGTVEATIALAANALDCSNNTIPYTFDFDDAAMAQCWSIVDANNDAKTFSVTIDAGGGYASYSYSATSSADDYLISPALNFTGGEICQIDYMAYSSNYPEKFQVLAFGADTVELSSVITVSNVDPQTLTVGLDQLEGAYRIAFHCVSDSNMWRLYLSNFRVAIPTVSMEVSATEFDFGEIPMNTTSDVMNLIVSTIVADDAVSLETAAPFEISLDGEEFAATATIPANAAITTNDTVYVRFAPTTVDNFEGTLTVTVGDITKTVALTGSSVDCSGGISELPFIYDFNSGAYPPSCWTVGDKTNFVFADVDTTTGDKALGFRAADYLISPEINVTGAPMKLTFDYINGNGLENDDEAPTTFRVGYSSTNDYDSFTWMAEQTAATTAFENKTVFIPANAKYIAIDVVEMGYYLLWGMFQVPDYLFIDNFKLEAATETEMLVSQESINFGQIIAGTQSQATAVEVLTVNLTESITVTSPANFEVSENGTAFAATATIPAEGGSFYVRYNPTAVGAHNGNITLTSGSTTKTIAVNGNAIDCSSANNLPYSEDFENGFGCWTVVSQNTNITWELYTVAEGSIWASCSYDEAANQDEKLISPVISFAGDYTKIDFTFDFSTSYFYLQGDPETGENHNVLVYISTDGGQTFPNLVYNMREDAGEFENYTPTTAEIDLTQYIGQQNVKVMFEYVGEAGAQALIDNITINGSSVGVENFENSTRVYPNPASNVVNVESSSVIDFVEIFNMNGQLLDVIMVDGIKTTVSTSNLSNGIYMMKVHTENGISNQKFTVVR